MQEVSRNDRISLCDLKTNTSDDIVSNEEASVHSTGAQDEPEDHTALDVDRGWAWLVLAGCVYNMVRFYLCERKDSCIFKMFQYFYAFYDAFYNTFIPNSWYCL